jgi:hypothetical protein
MIDLLPDANKFWNLAVGHYNYHPNMLYATVVRAKLVHWLRNKQFYYYCYCYVFLLIITSFQKRNTSKMYTKNQTPGMDF